MFYHYSLVICPAEGQIYSSNCLSDATCDKDPFQAALCDSARCACPLDQALDKAVNACVDPSKCCKLL